MSAKNAIFPYILKENQSYQFGLKSTPHTSIKKAPLKIYNVYVFKQTKAQLKKTFV